MSEFVELLSRIPELRGCPKHGLEAIEKEHAKVIGVAKGASLKGSLYLDECLKAHPEHAQRARWDYIVSVIDIGKTKCLVCLEFHNIGAKEVSRLIDKLMWLKEKLNDWTNGGAEQLRSWKRKYYVIGPVYISRASKEHRRLANAGIEVASRVVLS
ncbi:MAG: hypothetical protein ABDH91_08910 [Bacteroidia bacterium]